MRSATVPIEGRARQARLLTPPAPWDAERGNAGGGSVCFATRTPSEPGTPGSYWVVRAAMKDRVERPRA
jgi:hypothetical protein